MAENCWILVSPDGTEIDNGDHVEHYDTKAKAAKRAADDAAEGEDGPGYFAGGTPRQLDQPCLIVRCACCDEIYDESGEGYIVHFDNAAEAKLVTEAEWTEHGDGTFRCTACSPDGDCSDCRSWREVVTERA